MGMASISSTLPSTIPFPRCTSSIINTRNQLSLPFTNLKASRVSTSRIFVAPGVLESNVDTASLQGEDSTPSTLNVVGESDKVSLKQKIRIKLRSYWVPLIEDWCKQIMDAARTTNAKIMGPVPLPTKKRIYCVLKSPHVHKDAKVPLRDQNASTPRRHSLPNCSNHPTP